MSGSDRNNPENFNADTSGNPEVTPPPGPPPPDPGYAVPPPPPAGEFAYDDQAVQPDYNQATDSLANPSKDERNWAMFAHLSAIVVGLLASAVGLPIFAFLGPLVIYLMKKDESLYIADQAREALNFHITLAIVGLVLIVLSLTIILIPLTVLAGIVVFIGGLILCIVAAIKASSGELYRYPFALRLIN